jgi:hypothetical protein
VDEAALSGTAPPSCSTIGREIQSLVGLARARNGSKPARNSLKEQHYAGRAEFFAPPCRRPLATRLDDSFKLKLLFHLHIIVPPEGVGRRGIETVAVVGEWWVGVENVVNTES